MCLSTARAASHFDPDTDSSVSVKPNSIWATGTSTSFTCLHTFQLLLRSGFLCLRDNLAAFENMH